MAVVIGWESPVWAGQHEERQLLLQSARLQGVLAAGMGKAKAKVQSLVPRWEMVEWTWVKAAVFRHLGKLSLAHTVRPSRWHWSRTWTVAMEQKKPTSLVPVDREGAERRVCQNSLKHYLSQTPFMSNHEMRQQIGDKRLEMLMPFVKHEKNKYTAIQLQLSISSHTSN